MSSTNRINTRKNYLNWRQVNSDTYKYMDLLKSLKESRKKPVVQLEAIANLIGRILNQKELRELINYLNKVNKDRYGSKN